MELVKDMPTMSKSAVGKTYGLSSSTAHETWIARDAIIKQYQKLGSKNAAKSSRVYKRKMDVMEAVLMAVVNDEIRLETPLSDRRIRDLAMQTYMEMLPRMKKDKASEAIVFSNGWIQNFKFNHGIKMHVAHGEAGSVDLVKHKLQFEEIAKQVSLFEPWNVFNCDETGLYLKVLPNKGLLFKVARGRKIIKDAGVSILLCCNADSSKKRKPFLLSAYRPKGLDADVEAAFKTDFKGTGYMNMILFKEWLLELDADMIRQDRKIALLMDNAPGHAQTDDLGLQNVTIIRFPAGTTSVSQPLDAGIIRSFKVKYTNYMIQVVSLPRQEADSAKAKIPNASLYPCLLKAWNAVTQSIIRICFAHVPTIPKAMKDVLREQVDTHSHRDEDLKALQEALADMYPDRADAIKKQNDFGALAYIESCLGKGPTRRLTDDIDAAAASEEWGGHFMPPESLIMVDGDEDDDEEDNIFDDNVHLSPTHSLYDVK